ncbi:hypothetical protein B0H14DRAFT_2566592 [Mycena olivaceomarginata]|nr:hypothetical protein B0H14DRAFT_2566592 [Mycena olivaceomarginata]
MSKPHEKDDDCYESIEGIEFFYTFNQRKFNNSNITYFLPSDEEEIQVASQWWTHRGASLKQDMKVSRERLIRCSSSLSSPESRAPSGTSASTPRDAPSLTPPPFIPFLERDGIRQHADPLLFLPHFTDRHPHVTGPQHPYALSTCCAEGFVGPFELRCPELRSPSPAPASKPWFSDSRLAFTRASKAGDHEEIEIVESFESSEQDSIGQTFQFTFGTQLDPDAALTHQLVTKRFHRPPDWDLLIANRLLVSQIDTTPCGLAFRFQLRAYTLPARLTQYFRLRGAT